MVNLTTFMVIATAAFLGIDALDVKAANKLKQELMDAKIIPEAVGEFEPLTKLKIAYDEQDDLKNGETLKPEQTLVAPSIWFDAPDSNTEYTLTMVNLDTNGPLVRHWVATNVKSGDDRGTAFLSKLASHEYTSYKGPTPPQGTGKHRVAFVLYQQQQKNQTFYPDVDSSAIKDRAFFNLTQFAQENQLTPISAAYFLTEYQEGFSQQYPPVSDDIRESGLLDDLLGDIAVDVDVHLSVTIGDVLDGQEPSASSGADGAVPTADKNGLLSGVVGNVENLLGDLLGTEGDSDDDSDDNDIGILQDKVQIDLNGSKITLRQEDYNKIKQAGLLDGLLDDLNDLLDGALDIDINIGHNKDKDREGSYSIQGYAASPSTSVGGEAAQSSEAAKLKQAGLLDDLLEGLDKLLGLTGDASIEVDISQPNEPETEIKFPIDKSKPKPNSPPTPSNTSEKSH